MLCLAVLLTSSFCMSSAVTSVSAASATTGMVNGSLVNIRKGPSRTTPSLGQVSYVQVTILGSENGEDGYVWYHITYGNITGYIRSDLITLSSAPATDSTFEEQIAAFPESYKAGLRSLHETYPNWSFTADFLSMSLETAVANENVGFKKEVSMNDSISWRSLGDGIYDWSSGKWNTDSGNWTAASKEVIAFYMDPRNFLNADDVYMFAQQSYNVAAQTAAGVERIVAGTFLANGYSDPEDTAYGGSYINVIMEAARQSGVNPYVLAATIVTEQGTNGSSLCSGTTSYGKYFNFFNYGASGSNVLANGFNYAIKKGWTTRSKSIIEGAKLYAGGYVNAGQDTYYYKDFNVITANPYTHQYAQSVYDAKTSGGVLRSYYRNNPQTELTIRIPVYQNMSDTPAPRPENSSLLNNYYFTSISANGLSPSFSMYTQRYSLNVSGDTTVSVRMPDGASLASAGSVALSAGINLVTLSVRAQTGYTNDYILSVNATAACTLNITTGDTSSPGLVLGDADFDGQITIVDLAAVKLHLLGIRPLSGDSLSAADVNRDGIIDIVDLAGIKLHLLGIRKIEQ